MSVYKEIGHLARDVQSQSHQIYSDACDYGVPIKSHSDPLIKQLKSMIKMYGMKCETHRYSTGLTRKAHFDGGWPAVIEAGFERATFTFVSIKDLGDFIGYLHVEVSTSMTAQLKANAHR